MQNRTWIIRTYCDYKNKTVDVEMLREPHSGGAYRILRHENISKASQHRVLLLIRDKPTRVYNNCNNYIKREYMETYCNLETAVVR